jgi:hypothetical protein
MKTKEIAIETKARSSGLFGVLMVGGTVFRIVQAGEP